MLARVVEPAARSRTKTLVPENGMGGWPGVGVGGGGGAGARGRSGAPLRKAICFPSGLNWKSNGFARPALPSTVLLARVVVPADRSRTYRFEARNGAERPPAGPDAAGG